MIHYHSPSAMFFFFLGVTKWIAACKNGNLQVWFPQTSALQCPVYVVCIYICLYSEQESNCCTKPRILIFNLMLLYRAKSCWISQTFLTLNSKNAHKKMVSKHSIKRKRTLTKMTECGEPNRYVMEKPSQEHINASWMNPEISSKCVNLPTWLPNIKSPWLQQAQKILSRKAK